MKKLLSVIFVLTLSLSLSLSLCFGVAAKDTSGEAVLTSDTKYDAPRDEAEVREIILNMLGRKTTVIESSNRPDTLYGFYATEDTEIYVVYVVTHTDEGTVDAEKIIEIDRMGRDYNSYLITDTPVTNEARLNNAIRHAKNYIVSQFVTDFEISHTARELFIEIYGAGGNIMSRLPRRDGVVSVSYNEICNAYIAYIDTFDFHRQNVGIRAFVAINPDGFINTVVPLSHNFMDSGDNYPTDAEVDRFFSQYSGLGITDIYNTQDIHDCDDVCGYFKNALTESIKISEDMKPSWFEELVDEIFGGTADPLFVMIGIIAVAVIALIVFGAVLLAAAVAIAVFIIIIIIIAVSVKKKKKKKLAAKKAAEEIAAAEEKADTEPAEEATPTEEA